jgi:choline dehydrogenase-like flavoprotein
MTTRFDTDVIVVGSGPGGATLARALARAGRRVLLLERGREERRRPYYGTYLGAIFYSDRGSLLFTREGLNIVRPLMVGGATSMYCGCAAPPPDWLKTRYGVDIDLEVSETVEELELAPLPAELRGPSSTRIATAAGALGQVWQPQLKFMRPERAHAEHQGSGGSAGPATDGGSPLPCGAHCMLGCRCGAKWSAAEFVDDAVASGATLLTGARVDRVLTTGRRVVGVEGWRYGQPFAAAANVVVLAAGGIGSPRILQASGFAEAGHGMTMDTTVMVYGIANAPGIGYEPPMTWAWHNDADGYMLSTLIDPWLLYPLITALKGWRYPLTWPQWGNILGVMIKLTDELSGGVFANGVISKPMTPRDRERLNSAEQVARRILVEAGADPSSLFTSPLRGTHPGSTVRIGTLVDQQCQTALRGLYVCDASVFPEALGRPTVLTIIGLAKRLAKRLLDAA